MTVYRLQDCSVGSYGRSALALLKPKPLTSRSRASPRQALPGRASLGPIDVALPDPVGPYFTKKRPFSSDINALGSSIVVIHLTRLLMITYVNRHQRGLREP